MWHYPDADTIQWTKNFRVLGNIDANSFSLKGSNFNFVSKSGDTMTGDLNMGLNEIIFGASSDASITHDGTNFVIDVDTGNAVFDTAVQIGVSSAGHLKLVPGTFPALTTHDSSGNKKTQWINTSSGASTFDYSGSSGGTFKIRKAPDSSSDEVFRLATNGQATFSYPMTLNVGTSSATIAQTITGSTTDRQRLFINNNGTGDAQTSWAISGSSKFSFGVDNSDSDKLKLVTGASVSSGNKAFEVDSSGVMTMGTTLNSTFGLRIPNGTFNDSGVVPYSDTIDGTFGSASSVGAGFIAMMVDSTNDVSAIVGSDGSSWYILGSGQLSVAAP